MAEGEVRRMSLSKQINTGGQTNVIKLNSSPYKVKITDYRSILEEIEADKRYKVNVNVNDMEERLPEGKEAAEVESGQEQDNKQEIRNALTASFEEGFEIGKTESAKALQKEYEKKAEEIVKSFALVVQEFAKETERYEQEFEKAVVTLALAIARRVVAREIEIDETAVLARSREAIRKIIGVDKIKIHVNPADEEYIREHRNDLSNYADSVKEIVIEADNKVERGGCIIESDLGNIDARVSTQFELVEEALLDLVK